MHFVSPSAQIIKKVMKMDAAEAFNTPVNPIALGIPVSLNLSTDLVFRDICSEDGLLNL